MSNGSFPSLKANVHWFVSKASSKNVIWFLRAWRHMALTCLLTECPKQTLIYSFEHHRMENQGVQHLELLSPNPFSGQRGTGQET